MINEIVIADITTELSIVESDDGKRKFILPDNGLKDVLFYFRINKYWFEGEISLAVNDDMSIGDIKSKISNKLKSQGD